MNLPQFITAVAFCAASAVHSQNLPESVYFLPPTPGPVTYMPIEQTVEYGDSAVLSGSARFLTEATVPVYSNIARTGVVTFSLYGAVPADFSFPPGFEVGQPGVSPGTMADFKPAVDPIWTSGPVAVSFTGDGPTNQQVNQLVFSDINTLVPDELFWSIRFDSLSGYSDGGDFGPLLADASGVGPAGAATDGSRFYQRASDRFQGDWIPVWLDADAPPTSSLAVGFTAIPEPGIVALSMMGTLALLRRIRPA